MVQSLYKRILLKLGLSREQLEALLAKLEPDQICAGPFVQGAKMCPNTTALSIKLGRDFENGEVRKLLKQYNVSRSELTLFYLLFDLPAMISKKFFEKSLTSLRAVVKELINQRMAQR